MKFQENSVLFGADPTPGIVAVEFNEPNRILIYRRDPSGSTHLEEATLRPFLWCGEPLAGAQPLEGTEALNVLAAFPSWAEWEAVRSDLKKAGLPHFAWTDPVQQFLVQSGKTLFKGMDFADLRRMQIDIETDCAEGYEFSNAERDPLLAIAVSDTSGWEEFIPVGPGEESERQALERLTELIQERDPDVIEGHNLFKFDLPYLLTRAKRLKTKLAWGRDGSTLRTRSSRLQIAEKLIQYPKPSVHGRHVVDTWVLTQFYDISSRELESFGLKAVARHFGVAETGRVLVEGRAMAATAAADPDTFRLYALQDVRETRAVASLLSGSYFFQAQIFPYTYQDVIIRGNATRIDSLFLREYYRQGRAIPDFPIGRSFEGGYTDIFATGVIRDIWHCDVASLYPSVMLAFDLAPSRDSLGIFRDLLRDLRTFRLEAKQAAREEVRPAPERMRYEALQNTFKILINSFYGYLGFSQGHFADFAAASAVTAKGRDILKTMVAFLERRGARVIEIDTDGIYFHPPAQTTPEALDAALAKELPPGIEVEFEKTYAAMFSYKAKNYALLGHDGRMIIKGAALKSRGLEKFLREYLEGLIRALLEERPKDAAGLAHQWIERLRRQELPVEMFMKTEALQDSLASYEKKIGSSARNRSAAFELAIKSGRPYQAGDQISYYITGTKAKVTAYENARLSSEWNPEARDENVEYYVAKVRELEKKFATFLTPTDDLFAAS